MQLKAKKRGLGLQIRTFKGQSGHTYLVFRTQKGSFHVFREIEAKEAARDCGAKPKGNVRQMWNRLWKEK